MKTIHHVLDIDAGVDDVWSALTTQDGLAGWWADVVHVDGDVAGAIVRFTFAGDFNPVMRIETVDEPRTLTWRCIDGHDNWADNLFEFELVRSDDDKTRLRFTQQYAVELSDDDYGIYNFNWGYYLESLRLLCTTKAGKPFRIST